MWPTPAATGAKVRTIGTKRARMMASPPKRVEERVGAVDVLDAEQAGFLAFEDPRAEFVPDQVADFTAEERGEADRQADPPDVDAEYEERAGEQAGDHEQRVARKQEPDEKPGLGEDDRAHHQTEPMGRRRIMMISGSSQGMREVWITGNSRGRQSNFREWEITRLT